MNRQDRQREQHSVNALHAAGRQCGRVNCPGCPPPIDFDAIPDPPRESA